MNTDDFLKKMSFINNSINLEKFNYINSHTKGTANCTIHGDWYVMPYSLLNGSGCPKCALHKKSIKLRSNFDFLKEKIISINKCLNLSKFSYINNKTKSIVICIKHGEFLANTKSLLNGHGCPKCAGVNKKDLHYFLCQMTELHPKLSFEKFVYDGAHKRGIVICTIEGHKEFMSTPNNLIKGHGCKMCNQSKGENAISKYLTENKIRFEVEKKFIFCKHKTHLPFDFYLTDFNILIEYDGSFHYKENRMIKNENKRKLEYLDRVYKDDIKTKWAKENGIPLIRIPYTEIKNIEKILDNLLFNF